MYVIVGLGNPGLGYQKTRHNIGFMALDMLAEKIGVKIKDKKFSGLLGEGELAGQKVILVKPQTYMNLSGECVQQVLHFYKLPPEKLIVLCDDVDLPVGSLRIRAKGSAGTHNGLKNIIACIHSENFARIRMGCGQDVSLQLRDYVLKKPSKAEMMELRQVYDQAAQAVALMVNGDIEGAQSRFNKKHEKNPRQAAQE